ncbi:MAG: amidase [Myxococcota bacterium]|jgi:amidase
MHSDLLSQPAIEQADQIRRGQLSAVELLSAYQERIDRWDPTLHAFVERFPRTALRRARAVDRAVARGRREGSLLGIPFAIKDTDAVRFSYSRAGSRAYRYLWTPVDAPLVTRLRAAGVVLTGKTATSELALMPVVETDLQPGTANPWSPEHSAGGSSGGAAAAVAAGMLPVAHAADGGGSIRIPAAFCHLYGFKASRGLTPNFYAAFDKTALSVAGCVARSVADSAAVMDALCGRPDRRAPGSLLSRLDHTPPAGLKVKLCLHSPIAPTDPEIGAGVEAVARLLEDMGHNIEPVGPIEGSLDDFLPIFQRVAAAPPALSEGSFQPVTRWLREAGRAVTDREAQRLTDTLQQRVLDWFGDADLVLSPTVGCFPPRVRQWADLPVEEHFAEAAALGAFTAAFNASGQPAASIPAGLGASGLPFGVQLVGRPGQDQLVLQVSRSLEEALQWEQRIAPMRSSPSATAGSPM